MAQLPISDAALLSLVLGGKLAGLVHSESGANVLYRWLAGARMDFTYCNYAQEVERRVCLVGRVCYGTALPWHPTPSLLLLGFDLSREAQRYYDLARVLEIHNIERSPHA